jgi:signal transduction histidine kinase
LKRLYLRIYLAVLASLAVFALLAGLGWRLGWDRERSAIDERALIAELVAEILPPADAPVDAQRAALERWHARSRIDLGLFAADGTPIASAGQPIPVPAARGWSERGWGEHRGPPVFSVQLPDGRVAAARAWRGPARWPFGWGTVLLALAVAVGIGAHPVVRRITRRLERLQTGVEALGAGDLSARVEVRGRDEIAALATSFNRAAGRIEALVTSHRSLLANASHELRSPLARLRMAIELAGQSPGPGIRPDLAGEIERNIAELDALIEEILLASRLDASAGIAHEPLDLLALLAEECARARATLETAPGGPDGAVPATVSGDPRLLRRLVRNLLDNARRHGGGTAVDVALRVDASHAEFDVCDRGPGVPIAERERIFEPFHRLAGHGEGAGGVGLGLSLVRQIAQRHGGTVACLSRDGGGSCFRVRLPRAARPG